MLLKMRIECGQVSPAGLAKRIEPQTFQVGASRNHSGYWEFCFTRTNPAAILAPIARAQAFSCPKLSPPSPVISEQVQE